MENSIVKCVFSNVYLTSVIFRCYIFGIKKNYIEEFRREMAKTEP